MAKGLIYIAGLILIIMNSIGFLGGVIGTIGFIGKPIEEIIKLLNIHPKFPKLLYFGAISGLITAPIYIFAGINLLRMRSWARRLLLWFIPVMLIIDTIYLFLVDLLNSNTLMTLIIELAIWLILLNKTIGTQFQEELTTGPTATGTSQ